MLALPSFHSPNLEALEYAALVIWLMKHSIGLGSDLMRAMASCVLKGTVSLSSPPGSPISLALVTTELTPTDHRLERTLECIMQRR